MHREASKAYSVTGWRLGYIIAPTHIIDVAKKVHDFLTVGAAAPLQEAAVTGLGFGDDYYKWLQDKYTGKRDLFLKGLLDISEFRYNSDLEFCEALARDVGVGAVLGSSFFREPVNHLIRLHFAKKDETLNKALNRLEGLDFKNHQKVNIGSNAKTGSFYSGNPAFCEYITSWRNTLL